MLAGKGLITVFQPTSVFFMNLKFHLLSWSYLNWHYRVKIWVREGKEKIDLLGMFSYETCFCCCSYLC